MYNEYLARAEHEYRMERFLAEAGRVRSSTRADNPSRLNRLFRRLSTRRRATARMVESTCA